MRITVLGSTGSIGRNTLDVIARHPEQYQVFALTGFTQIELLAQQCDIFQPKYAVLIDPFLAKQLQDRLKSNNIPTEVICGEKALEDVCETASVDAVMSAIVGAAGLKPTLAAARSGKRLMLANKESLVVAGALMMRLVQDGNAELFPVDSEHSAIFQCLPLDRRLWPKVIEKIVLTASGGPFRTRDLATFAQITPQEACAHPNWNMGRKISVDSATMMNKALEVIEARWLFDTAAHQIEAIIHPQSIVHSMLACQDGSVMAQLGMPDMRVPIAVSLAWPSRVESGAQCLDFTQLKQLDFEVPDTKRFPCLPLAWQALAAPEGTTAVLNAANEIAVAAFLQKRLRFDHIYVIVHQVLSSLSLSSNQKTLEELLTLDLQARAMAHKFVTKIQN